MTVWLNECTSLDQSSGRNTSVVGIAPRAHRVNGTLRAINHRVIDAGSDPLRLRALGAIDCGIAATLTPGEPVVGVRRNGRGLALVPIGVNARVGTNVLDGTGNVIGREWAGAWTGAKLRFFFGGHFIRKEIVLSAGHAQTFDFKIRRAGDWTGNLPRATARGFDVDDDNGHPLFFAQKPYLFKPGDETAASVPVNLLLRQVAGEWYLRLALPAPVAPATDWSGWVLEPTWTSQPGAAAGKDLLLNSGQPTFNYGVFIRIKSANTNKGLVEFDASAISAGATCTSATLTLYQALTGAAQAWVCTVYSIAVGNAAWGEGTQNGAQALAGEPCWNALAADGAGGVTTAWAGSAGLATSGTDYEVANSGTFSGNRSDADGTAYTRTLTPSRVRGWFGSPNTNYGLLITSDQDVGGLASSDHATAAWRPTLTVEYTAGGGNGSGRGRTPLLARGGW